MNEALCAYCGKPADGAMLTMGDSMAHADCVIRRLNELLDYNYDGIGEPIKIVGYHKHQGEPPVLSDVAMGDLLDLEKEYTYPRSDGSTIMTIDCRQIAQSQIKLLKRGGWL